MNPEAHIPPAAQSPGPEPDPATAPATLSTREVGGPQLVPDHELLRIIGKGSYGEVWLAKNIMGTWRAVKIIRRDAFESERPYEREFMGIRRSEPVSRSHEGMVDILHIGRSADDSYFYYVMELADSAGSDPDLQPDGYKPLTLSARLRDGKGLSAEECLRLVTGMASVLAHLHEFRLIHRDVKPSNILYFSDLPKLADIGLVTDVDSSRSFVGTEGYVPHEGPGSEQGDIYGLGKSLYEALTGYDRLRYPEVPPDWADKPDFKTRLELNEIVLRACEPVPSQRYRTAREMMADAALIASGTSLKRLRGIEQGFRYARIALALVSGICLLAGVAFFWQQRETEITREQLARQQSEAVAKSARQEADLAKWYGLQAQANAAVYERTAGGTRRGLEAIRQAAKVRPSMELRNTAAHLLTRPDLTVLEPGRIEPAEHFILLNLPQSCYLRLSYRKDTSRSKRSNATAQVISLEGKPTLPMPPDFVTRHQWKLRYNEYGTEISDEGGRRWPVPGTTPKPVETMTDIRDNAALLLAVPRMTSAYAAPRSDWTAAISSSETGANTIYPFYRWQPTTKNISRSGGGASLAFLEPPQFLASSDWAGSTQVHDLISGAEAINLDHAGWPLIFDAEKSRLGLHGWEFDEAWVYQWQPSPVFHRHLRPAASIRNVRFTPEGKYLYFVAGDTVHWREVSATTRPTFRTQRLPHNGYLHFSDNPQRPEAYLFNESQLTILDYTAPTSDAPEAALFANPRPHAVKPADVPQAQPRPASSLCHVIAYHPSGSWKRIEGFAASMDGRVLALADYGPIGVWRDGKIWRCFQVNWAAYTGDGVRIDLSPDGRILAIGSHHAGSVWIWDLEGKEDQPVLLHEEKFANSAIVSFSPHGRWLGISGDIEHRVLETGTWKVLARWPRKAKFTGFTGFSQDSRWLFLQHAAGSITLVETESWSELVTLRTPYQEKLTSLSISPDRRWFFATVSQEPSYLLWDLERLDQELTELNLGWDTPLQGP